MEHRLTYDAASSRDSLGWRLSGASINGTTKVLVFMVGRHMGGLVLQKVECPTRDESRELEYQEIKW